MRQHTSYRSLSLDIEAVLERLTDDVKSCLKELSRKCKGDRPAMEQTLQAIQHVLFAVKGIRAKQIETGCFVDCVLVTYALD